MPAIFYGLQCCAFHTDLAANSSPMTMLGSGARSASPEWSHSIMVQDVLVHAADTRPAFEQAGRLRCRCDHLAASIRHSDRHLSVATGLTDPAKYRHGCYEWVGGSPWVYRNQRKPDGPRFCASSFAGRGCQKCLRHSTLSRGTHIAPRDKPAVWERLLTS